MSDAAEYASLWPDVPINKFLAPKNQWLDQTSPLVISLQQDLTRHGTKWPLEEGNRTYINGFHGIVALGLSSTALRMTRM